MCFQKSRKKFLKILTQAKKIFFFDFSLEKGWGGVDFIIFFIHYLHLRVKHLHQCTTLQKSHIFFLSLTLFETFFSIESNKIISLDSATWILTNEYVLSIIKILPKYRKKL